MVKRFVAKAYRVRNADIKPPKAEISPARVFKLLGGRHAESCLAVTPAPLRLPVRTYAWITQRAACRPDGMNHRFAHRLFPGGDPRESVATAA